MGYDRSREDFTGHTGLVFDALGPPEAAASLTVGLILNPERDARLVVNHGRDPNAPSLDEVMHQLLVATWKAPASRTRNSELKERLPHMKRHLG